MPKIYLPIFLVLISLVAGCSDSNNSNNGDSTPSHCSENNIVDKHIYADGETYIFTHNECNELSHYATYNSGNRYTYHYPYGDDQRLLIMRDRDANISKSVEFTSNATFNVCQSITFNENDLGIRIYESSSDCHGNVGTPIELVTELFVGDEGYQEAQSELDMFFEEAVSHKNEALKYATIQSTTE